ncbi:glutamine-hydrolyzing GMP synthase [Candidatus Profftia sp. (ex Adelges kitamiensis)]|uniref:glutamine-hydrolyzing GMP synthase n=1 Tax=Candidatus Profftia sp. (ex Adelges kitamiensis) TaxID=2864218 RepID=UPI001CE33C57|nr:glutamine-hydrolyzing GMP synthase [Candidatus Profftia sp. (ex Adelges kitamiensis)]
MNHKIHSNCILILDFGSQYTQLLARRVREIGVYSELCLSSITKEQIKNINPRGIILSGSPKNTNQYNSPRAPEYVFNAGVPVLGICYGMQTMAIQLGGHVENSTKREFGYARVKVTANSKMFNNIQDSLTQDNYSVLDVWMSHGDKITAVPSNFIGIASTENCPYAIIVNEERRFYGVQFHPEVTHTRQGKLMLRRFILDICGCEALWTPSTIIDNIIIRLHEKIGKDEVILGLSGGIDSLVASLLLHRAIGKRLTCVFVDNGLLRLYESQKIMKMFSEKYSLNIIQIQAEDRFLKALSGIKDPEDKRKTIGRIFIEIFHEEACKKPNIKWLAQGTIYPDVIESVASIAGQTHIIKSHHNVGGLPKKMKLRLIEPLKWLFKDEVRKIAKNLGQNFDLQYLHPFPGPGLGVRILGEVKKEYCNLIRLADDIFIEELHKANLYNKVSQAFAVFLPIRSVGVMGDIRKYDWVIALRAVETIDFMTARWARLPYDFLDHVSNRIINEVHGISRVVYDISGKPPATIEWE